MDEETDNALNLIVEGIEVLMDKQIPVMFLTLGAQDGEPAVAGHLTGSVSAYRDFLGYLVRYYPETGYLVQSAESLRMAVSIIEERGNKVYQDNELAV